MGCEAERSSKERRLPGHWFEEVADHLGPAYLRYSFTKGTQQEVEFLVEMLEISPGDRVLDVGCGPGRHALSLARLGYEVVGVDISQEFVGLASASAAAENLDNATFVVGDARDLGFEAEFDVVISLCQGGFGLTGGPGAQEMLPARELDEPILAGIAAALTPGGRAGVSAFSAYFVLQYLEEQDTFDADTGVNHETTTLKNERGEEVPAELWTTCFTPRELRLLSRIVGLRPTAVHGVSPGAYATKPPALDVHEFLLVATKD